MHSKDGEKYLEKDRVVSVLEVPHDVENFFWAMLEWHLQTPPYLFLNIFLDFLSACTTFYSQIYCRAEFFCYYFTLLIFLNSQNVSLDFFDLHFRH